MNKVARAPWTETLPGISLTLTELDASGAEGLTCQQQRPVLIYHHLSSDKLLTQDHFHHDFSQLK